MWHIFAKFSYPYLKRYWLFVTSTYHFIGIFENFNLPYLLKTLLYFIGIREWIQTCVPSLVTWLVPSPEILWQILSAITQIGFFKNWICHNFWIHCCICFIFCTEHLVPEANYCAKFRDMTSSQSFFMGSRRKKGDTSKIGKFYHPVAAQNFNIF